MPSNFCDIRVSHSLLLGMQSASVISINSFEAAFIPSVADSFLIDTLQLVSGMKVVRMEGYLIDRRVRMSSVVANESEFITITSKSGWLCSIMAGIDCSRKQEFVLSVNTITEIGCGGWQSFWHSFI